LCPFVFYSYINTVQPSKSDTNMTEEIDKLLNKHDRRNWQLVEQTWPKKLTTCWTNMTEEIDKLLNKHDRRSSTCQFLRSCLFNNLSISSVMFV
jgi:phage I-like protein